MICVGGNIGPVRRLFVSVPPCFFTTSPNLKEISTVKGTSSGLSNASLLCKDCGAYFEDLVVHMIHACHLQFEMSAIDGYYSVLAVSKQTYPFPHYDEWWAEAKETLVAKMVNMFTFKK